MKYKTVLGRFTLLKHGVKGDSYCETTKVKKHVNGWSEAKLLHRNHLGHLMCRQSEACSATLTSGGWLVKCLWMLAYHLHRNYKSFSPLEKVKSKSCRSVPSDTLGRQTRLKTTVAISLSLLEWAASLWVYVTLLSILNDWGREPSHPFNWEQAARSCANKRT